MTETTTTTTGREPPTIRPMTVDTTHALSPAAIRQLARRVDAILGKEGRARLALDELLTLSCLMHLTCEETK